MLAWQESALIERVVSGHLPAFTPHTITNASDLRGNLARIRSEGFAAQSAEWHSHEYAVAAPIFGHGGNVVAAIGLSGESVPNMRATIYAIAPAVMQAARTASRKLAQAE